MTPLHVACRRNHIKVVQLLLKYGTPVDATTTVSDSLTLPGLISRFTVCLCNCLFAIFSARCNIYISRLCYDVSVPLSVRLSVCL